MKKNNKLKLNNSGSTFLFVVVALIFIGLLAALVMALTVSGYKMKTVDYNSRQNFYESEEFSGKIYSEIGMNAVGILGEAYVTTMGKLNSGSISSEADLNEHIKELYYKNMLVYLRIADSDAAAESYVSTQKTTGVAVEVPAGNAIITNNVLPLLKDMVKDPDNPAALVPKLEIKGKIVCDLQGETDPTSGEVYPTITINDVHLQYIDPSTRFETNLTFDIVVRYPEWDFTYSNPVSTSLDIDTWLDYILISNDGIEFDGVSEDVYGCVATGTNSIVANNDDDTSGINLTSGATVSFNPTGSVGSYKYESLEIVATDNIILTSSVTNESSMTVNGGEIWCNSVILKRERVEDQENTNKSYFQTNGTRLYIQDDLQLDGDYSEAQVLNGSYFGYSNNTTNGANSQHSSSAIIINGNNSKVNLQGLDKLYVNGLAYIDYINRNNPYRTGESLSVKGNQDIYMVPDAYMGETFSNPVNSLHAMSAADKQAMANNLLTKFFGKAYLDPTMPYIEKTYVLNSKTYIFYYLNFASPSLQTDYVIDVLTASASDTTVEKEIRERVQKNLSEMNMSSTQFLSAEASTLYAAGAVVTATGGDKLGSATATESTADVLVNQMSFINRFRLMKSLLMTMTDPDAVVDNFNTVYSKVFAQLHADDATKYPYPYSAVQNYLLNNSAITNFINFSKLEAYAPIGVDWESKEHSTDKGKGIITYARRTSGDVYTLGDYTGVIVVDGDVEIRGDVRGLVIATGSITVTRSGKLVADALLVDAILTKEQDEDEPRSDVFLAYPCLVPPKFGDSISQLQYSDVLYYDNWRKFEDTETY